MPNLLIRHQVADFDQWKAGYDAHEAARNDAGLAEVQLMQGMDDPNLVVILFSFDDVEPVQALLDSDDMKQAMQDAGVVDQPDIYLLN